MSVYVTLELDKLRRTEDRQRVNALAADHAHAIQVTLERTLSATYALAALVRQSRGSFPNFPAVAEEMRAVYPGASILGLAPEGIVRQVVPLAGNERSIGFNAMQDPVQGPEARQAIKTKQLTLAGPFNLVQGGLGAVGRQPIYLKNAEGNLEFWGFTYVVMRFPEALSSARLDGIGSHGLDYELWRVMPDSGAHQTIASSVGSEKLVDPVQREINLPNGDWILSLAPQRGWADPAGVARKLGLGVTVSLLLSYLALLLVRLKRHEKGLELQVQKRTNQIFTAQNKLQATLDAIPDLMFELDLEGICHDYHVPSTAPYLQPSLDELKKSVGRHVRELLPPEATQKVLQSLQQAQRKGRSDGQQFQMEMSHGTAWFDISVAAKPADPDQAQRFIVLARDVTSRKQTETDLRVAATAFDANQGMAITDADKLIVKVNPAFTEITGYSQEEALGKSLNFLNSGRHDTAFYAHMWQTVIDAGSWRGEIWNRRRNGDIYPDMRSVTAVRGDGGQITHFVNTFSDITQRKATEDEIRKLAFYDALTLLPNRRLLQERLRMSLTSTARNHQRGALLFIDLDNFKTLNDTQGHDVGDLLLQLVAQRLTECVRKADTVARLGGDEFVMMLEELSADPALAAAHVTHVGEKVIEMLNRPYTLVGREFHITPSIGITLYDGQTQTSDELLKQADLAMYQAKAAGRNTMLFYDPEMQAVVTQRVALEADIRQGIAQQQFLLHYQPQVDGANNVLGVEALLRWAHPSSGMVAPSSFIPLAEETGLILPLGRWVLQRACTQLAEWAHHPTREAWTLAVNVSARQFRQADFVGDICQVLRDTGANPHRLKLELTETMLLTDLDDTIAKMDLLQQQGVGFSLDDFGTGYSSLAYLKLLPLDQLKIDQSFVRDLLNDPNDAAIARTVIALARSLGLAVIAEGVETDAQHAFLLREGCDAYQGYLFTRPLPVDALEAWAEAREAVVPQDA
jgi:diguanylate cyclase (GGDEF)-like protein/PAS domain S-box-containing protein